MAITDPLIQDALTSFYQQDPRAGFDKFLYERDLFGLDPTASFAQGQYGRLYGQYVGQLENDPNQSFYNYLQGFNLRNQYQAQPAYLRGDTSGRRLTPPVRYISGI